MRSGSSWLPHGSVGICEDTALIGGHRITQRLHKPELSGWSVSIPKPHAPGCGKALRSQ